MNENKDEFQEESEGIVVVVAVVLAATIVCSILFLLATIHWEYLSKLLGINL